MTLGYERFSIDAKMRMIAVCSDPLWRQFAVDISTLVSVDS